MSSQPPRRPRVVKDAEPPATNDEGWTAREMWPKADGGALTTYEYDATYQLPDFYYAGGKLSGLGGAMPSTRLPWRVRVWRWLTRRIHQP